MTRMCTRASNRLEKPSQITSYGGRFRSRLITSLSVRAAKFFDKHGPASRRPGPEGHFRRLRSSDFTAVHDRVRSPCLQSVDFGHLPRAESKHSRSELREQHGGEVQKAKVPLRNNCASFCAHPRSKTVARGRHLTVSKSPVLARKINTIANHRTQ
jgi:hypothetical protein